MFCQEEEMWLDPIRLNVRALAIQLSVQDD